MKSQKPNKISRIMLSSLVLIALLAFSSGTAFAAGTAANTTISNTATVNYQDTGGNSQTPVQATATVTVNLVAAAPTLSQPSDDSTDPGTDAVYSYTITSNANGPDTYTLATTITNEEYISSSSAATQPTSIALGASSVAIAGSIAASGTTVITVPSDDTSDGSVNGITGGDTLVINNEVFTVASIDDSNGGNSGTSTITVNGNGVATPLAIGDSILEQKTFDLSVTPGTVSNNTQTPKITVDTSATNTNGDVATDTTVTTVNIASLTVTKVADVSTADPGDTITYTITVTNNGSSNAIAATVTDPVPQFTTYVANSTRLNNITVAGDGTTSPLIGGLAVDDDSARAPGAVATGVIQNGSSAVVTFQVTVD